MSPEDMPTSTQSSARGDLYDSTVRQTWPHPCASCRRTSHPRPAWSTHTLTVTCVCCWGCGCSKKKESAAALGATADDDDDTPSSTVDVRPRTRSARGKRMVHPIRLGKAMVLPR